MPLSSSVSMLMFEMHDFGNRMPFFTTTGGSYRHKFVRDFIRIDIPWIVDKIFKLFFTDNYFLVVASTGRTFFVF